MIALFASSCVSALSTPLTCPVAHTPSCRGEPVQGRRLHLHRGQCGRPSWRPDHLRCFLLRPWARWSRDQGAPHDPQQVQEAEENWFRRDLGLSTPRHVQRSGKTIHCKELFPDNSIFQSKIMFAWAKHAQPTELPNDVGFSLQPDEYLVLQVLASSSNFIFDPHLPTPHQVHYAKPQKNDNSGLAVLVRQTKPKYTAGDAQSVEKIEDVKFYKQIRDVPLTPIPFENSSFYPGRPWRCQLPGQLEASSSCCPYALVFS